MGQGSSGSEVKKLQRLICAYHTAKLGWAAPVAASFKGFDDGNFGESTREQVENLNSEWLMEGHYPSTGSVATPQFVINLKTEIKKRGVDPNKAANIPCGSTEYPKL